MARIDEQGIIGCLLVDSSSFGKCTNIKSEMFQDSTTKLIFQAIERLIEANKPVTQQAIINACDGRLSADYVKKCLAECVRNIGSAFLEIEGYAEAIINDYNSRTLKEAAKALNAANITRNNCIDLKHDLIKKLSDIPDDVEFDDPSIAALVAEEKNTRFQKNHRKYLYFGMKNLDSCIGGLEGGDVAIIAARPSVGKSAFANQLIVNCCRKGLNVGLFNVELTKPQVYDRLLCHVAGIDLKRIRHATAFQSNEKELFDKGNAELESFKLNIHCGDISIEKIKSITELNRYDVIFIDYLQLISTQDKFIKRNEEVGRISKYAKTIAMNNKIPVVALSQLNRNNDVDKEPSMKDLGESGKIEQDASVVMFLWNKDGDKNKKGISVAKSRNGEPGKGLMTFEGSKMTFTEINTKREQVTMPDDGFVVGDPEDNPFFYG